MMMGGDGRLVPAILVSLFHLSLYEHLTAMRLHLSRLARVHCVTYARRLSLWFAHLEKVWREGSEHTRGAAD